MEHFSEHLIDKLERLPTKEAVPRGGFYRNQDFSFNRAKRWMQSHVGKNIDEVFSEWVNCTWVPARLRNREGFHYIVEDVRWIDGVACDDRWHLPLGMRSYFCANPKTKILEFNQVSKKDRRKHLALLNAKWQKEKTCVILGNHHQLFKEKGIWYELKFPIYQLFYGTIPAKTPYDMMSPFIRPSLKQQLSKDELKKHGLKNN